MFDWLKTIFRSKSDTPAARPPQTQPKEEKSANPTVQEKRRREKPKEQKPKDPKRRQPSPPAPASVPTEDAAENTESGEFIWCLVGNIVDEQYRTETPTTEDEKTETQHFSSHTKVYCFPPKGGDTYERCKVIGRHRRSKRHICVVIPSSYITNWRLQQVYKPYVVKQMRSKKGWTDSEEDKERIMRILTHLPDTTQKD